MYSQNHTKIYKFLTQSEIEYIFEGVALRFYNNKYIFKPFIVFFIVATALA